MKVQDAKALGEKLGYIFGTVVISCVMVLIIALTLKVLFLIF